MDTQNAKTEPSQNEFAEGSFGYDLNFLKQKDSGLVTLGSGDAQILVSPVYQGKIFTSTYNGDQGRSLGWINYEAFGKNDPHMNAYGGESRYWLGPEGNKYSLFFKKDSTMEFKNWKTPTAFDSEPWKLKSKSANSATVTKQMMLTNYAGTTFNMLASREITMLDKKAIADKLDTDLNTKNLNIVGYSTENSLKNTGDIAWNEETGAPCIWILDMLKPSDSTVILVPFKDADSEKIATTDYFGEIDKDRIAYQNNVLYFKADGKSRGKLGMPPERTKAVAGSYDAKNGLLTIIFFDVDNNAKYLNQEWNTTAPAYTGDAVNAYNDGPLEDGSQMGPFYEIESVSPAAFLSPGESIDHKHTMIHINAPTEELNKIMQHTFGITTDEAVNTLN